MKYRFNDRILFDADTGALSLCDFSDDPVPISNPSKRLLQLLIAHHGEAVSREVIFKKVWDDYGMVSSNNNLNQCVSKLRRVIKALGIDDDIIVTVPKVGFMLRREILVEVCEHEAAALNDDEDVLLVKPPVYVETPPPLPTVRTSPPKYAHYGWGLLVFLLVVISGLVIYTFAPISRQETYLGQAVGCKVFMSPSTDAELGNDVLAYAERQKVQCNADEYLLLVRSNQVKSYISGISRLFFLRCKVFREYKVEICSGLESESSSLM
ncbi:winged helix-turn-helix domain-containing protein [Serratia oryzae]|uniref:winged helix-turn-helix domain-containing protein n=1 Tax=Serratia oryzae TaxID=2034155 RepID=UPI0012E147E8|nr:winged helix-turn-helix domain-containing protein [Serratia oryzae]